MSDIQHQRPAGESPEGSKFLHAIGKFCQSAIQQSDAMLANDLHEAREALGTLISVLDQASSCFWACRGGDHAAEYLIGRSCTYAMGAFTLARSAFYDESLSLVRTIGEIANLAYLFAAIPTKLNEWQTLGDKERKMQFSPVKVRLALEESKRPVPIDQNRYGQLCEKATHLSPRIPPGMYNDAKHPRPGGYFQPAGLAVCMHETAYSLMIIATCTPDLLGLRNDHRERVDNAAQSMLAALPDLRSHVNTIFPGTYT